MRKIMALVLAVILCFGLVACTSTGKPNNDNNNNNNMAKSITVVTTYGGDDTNRQNYETAIKDFKDKFGVEILDASQASGEGFKSQVKTDFEVGSEPDVLLFFSGTDADSFVSAGKVVPVSEIRKSYPNYAANMREDLMPLSTYDGKSYVVPVNGYWEGLFVNKKILADSNVDVPGKDYTWEQFLADCDKIKAKGYIPIDLSINGMPHYWWEYAVLNNGTLENHLELARDIDDATAKKWLAAIDDIKTLYDRGYLPADTMTTTIDDVYGSGGYFRQDGKAAFTVDGTWYLGGLVSNIDKDILENYTYDDFCVSYVPAKGERKATDIINGISSGYYITRKAWDDPAKREAAVKFVQYMTSDEMVSKFSRTALTALKNGVQATDLNSLEQSAVDMCNGVTGSVNAVQDIMGKAKAKVFADLSSVISKRTKASDMIKDAISDY